MNNNQSSILRYFAHDHLPFPLNDLAYEFESMAILLDGALPNGPEKSVAFRKLLEAKDAAVRSALDLMGEAE